MKIPVVEQHDSSDCGVACAVSICQHYGKEITISKLRQLMGTDALGTSIYGICEGLSSIGFDSRAVYVDRDSFSKGDYTLPAIARIVREDGTAHYVAVYQVRNGTVRYMDPAEHKAQKKTVDEFCRDFDGGMIFLIPNEEFIRSKEGTASLFRSFLRMIRPQTGLFIVAIAMSVILTVFGILMAVFNKILVDEIIPYQEDHQLLLFGIALTLIVVTQTLIGAFRTHVILYLSQKIDIPMMLGYFEHIFKLPMSFFASRKTGDIVTRFQDAGVVKNVLTSTALTVVIDVCMVIIVGAVLIMQSVNLFAVVLVMTVLSAVLIYCFKAPYRKLNRQSMEQGARLNSQIIESLNNVETVKTNSSEQHTMEMIEAEYIKALRIGFRGGVLSNIQGSLSSAISGLGNLAVMVFGGFLAIEGTITLGTLIAFMSLSGYFIQPIGRLVSLQLSIQQADISLKRLSEIYDVEEESETESNKDALKGPITDVELKDVVFRYGTRPPVLHGVSIRVSKGEKVALVGRSGCGKTTISKLLLKFYTPESGEVRINGQDINELDPFALRSRIGCVPQNVQTFSGTVRENLLFGSRVTKQELDRACDMTGCTEFIKKLPAGYDTFLDDTGGGLSGGEKQRLIIARAILRNPDLLIMDEATSNMDFITEKTTFDLLFNKLRDRSMLIIAHRLSTIRSCDRIYVMDGGEGRRIRNP